MSGIRLHHQQPALLAAFVCATFAFAASGITSYSRAPEAVAEAVLSCVLLMVTEIQWKFMRCTATELILVVMPILTSAAILGALLCRAR